MGLNTYRDSVADGARADLARRIAALDVNTSHRRAADLAEDLDAIRRIAQAAGMLPAVSVAHVLDAALARGERGPLIHSWIEVLRDAIGCDRADQPACDAYVAACSVRLTS
jgi:hypothetical protein